MDGPWCRATRAAPHHARTTSIASIPPSTHKGSAPWGFTTCPRPKTAPDRRDRGILLDIKDGSTADGAPAIIWPWNTGTNQQWRFLPNGDGSPARHSTSRRTPPEHTSGGSWSPPRAATTAVNATQTPAAIRSGRSSQCEWQRQGLLLYLRTRVK
ncbi:RICIN domain-containing protein [Streptomyces sp. NPDC001178]